MLAYKSAGWSVAIVAFLSLAGCGSSDSGSKSSSGLGGAINAQNDARKKEEEAAAAAKAAADKKAAADAAASAQSQPPTEPPKKVGDRPKPEFGGYYGAIAGARRHVMNVVDSLSWIQGVRNFKAEKGRKPKNNAEFMKDCVKVYQLELPRIEEDEEYLYDPNGETDGDFGQLYIVKKGTAPESSPPPAGAPPSK